MVKTISSSAAKVPRHHYQEPDGFLIKTPPLTQSGKATKSLERAGIKYDRIVPLRRRWRWRSRHSLLRRTGPTRRLLVRKPFRPIDHFTFGIPTIPIGSLPNGALRPLSLRLLRSFCISRRIVFLLEVKIGGFAGICCQIVELPWGFGFIFVQ